MKSNSAICSEIQAQLPLYVGGDHEPELAGEWDGALDGDPVARHVAVCASCADELARLSVARTALEALRGERVAEINVWTHVRAELAGAGLIRGGVPHDGQDAPLATPARAARRWTHARRVRVAAGFLAAAGIATFASKALRNDQVGPERSAEPAGSSIVAADVGTSELPSPSVSGTPALAAVDAPTTPSSMSGALHKIAAEDSVYETAIDPSAPVWQQVTPRGLPPRMQAASFNDPRIR